ncbi:MAG: glutaredoxin family protein [Chloroflexota bacterium]|nr:glutaredoxin family protein [Chloroflexota bacterium]MDE3103342.1 glutaredoxin family protein [Chloroflexota bacterium]
MRPGDLRRALALVRRRTHRGPPLRVRFIEKADCHLCADAYRALRRVALDRPLEIDRVDIQGAPPEVHDRYVLRIPVLVVRGEELDVAGLDDKAIARWLAEVAPQGWNGDRP